MRKLLFILITATIILLTSTIGYLRLRNELLKVQGDDVAGASTLFAQNASVQLNLAVFGEIKPDGAICSNGEILKKTGANDWDCAADGGGSGGSAIELQDGSTDIGSFSSVSFQDNSFVVTDTTGEAFVQLDWTNGPASKAAANTWTEVNTFDKDIVFSAANSSLYFGNGISPQISHYFSYLGAQASSSVIFGQSSDSAGQEATFLFSGLTGNRTYTLPDQAGTFILSSGSVSFETTGYASASTVFTNRIGTSGASYSLDIGATIAQDNLISIDCLEGYANSTSVGGCINIDSTSNIGAGLVVYSNLGSTTTGRLVVVRCDNSAFDEDCFRIENDGTADGLSINNTNTGTSSNAISITGAGGYTLAVSHTGTNANQGAGSFSSTNAYTTLSITDVASGQGSIKVTHTGGGQDGSASGLSIDLASSLAGRTAAQGIFIDATTGKTTGKLFNIRNGGEEDLTLLGNGRLGLLDASPDARFEIVGTGSLDYFYITNSTDGDIFSIRQGGASTSLNFEISNYASASLFLGSAFSSVGDCNDSAEALRWTTTGLFSCGTFTGGDGITITADDIDFVATELEGLTWGGGAGSSIAWTFNLSGTDPVLTFNSGGVSITGFASASTNFEAVGYASASKYFTLPLGSGALTQNQFGIDDQGFGQFVYRASSSEHVLTDEKTMRIPIGSTSFNSWTSRSLDPYLFRGITVKKIACKVSSATSVVINLSANGTTDLDQITCLTTATFDDGSISNASIAKGAELVLERRTISSTPDYLTITIVYAQNRE